MSEAKKVSMYLFLIVSHLHAEMVKGNKPKRKDDKGLSSSFSL